MTCHEDHVMGVMKYLQNATRQLEVQGTQTKYQQQNNQNHNKLGSLGGLLLLFNWGGGHLLLTEKFSYHTVYQYQTIPNLSQCTYHVITAPHLIWEHTLFHPQTRDRAGWDPYNHHDSHREHNGGQSPQ